MWFQGIKLGALFMHIGCTSGRRRIWVARWSPSFPDAGDAGSIGWLAHVHRSLPHRRANPRVVHERIREGGSVRQTSGGLQRGRIGTAVNRAPTAAARVRAFSAEPSTTTALPFMQPRGVNCFPICVTNQDIRRSCRPNSAGAGCPWFLLPLGRRSRPLCACVGSTGDWESSYASRRRPFAHSHRTSPSPTTAACVFPCRPQGQKAREASVMPRTLPPHRLW